MGLLLLAVAEFAVFVAVAHVIGGGWALLLLVAVSVVGAAWLRREGVRGWRGFRAAAAEGRPPGEQVSRSLVGLFGALLLAVPGFLTAIAGLVLLVPPVRTLVRRGVERAATRRVGATMAGDLFGPRRVRVRRGEPVRVDTGEPPAATPGPAIEGEVVDGEIVR